MVEKLPGWLIKEWMRESLIKKIERSQLKIKQFYDELGGQVHVSTSGGKDSTVLLHLVRSMYPETKAVHVAVPRYPETAEFVKTIDNCVVLVPTKSFKEVIERYGYPVISKEVSLAIQRYRAAKNRGDKHMMQYRLTGKRKNGRIDRLGVIPPKWHFLVDAPFKISDYCCNVFKKHPLMKYEKKTGTRPYIGILASESKMRMRKYKETGCNVFKKGKEKSMPLSFWTEKDIWKYIGKFGLPYSPIYDLGETRTGCLFCLFGCHLEREPNRFQRLYHLHPKIYDYCMDDLGLRGVMEYVGIPHVPIHKLSDFPEFTDALEIQSSLSSVNKNGNE